MADLHIAGDVVSSVDGNQLVSHIDGHIGH